MKGSWPVTPQDLRTEVVIYRRVVTGVNAFGQQVYGYVKRRSAKVAVRRQKSQAEILQHNLTSSFSEYLWGNWWNWLDVAETDVILRVHDRVQFGLHGKPVNWQGRNRWAIVELVSNKQCLPGIESCYCDDETTPIPAGTGDVDQDLPEAPAP